LCQHSKMAFEAISAKLPLVNIGLAIIAIILTIVLLTKKSEEAYQGLNMTPIMYPITGDVTGQVVYTVPLEGYGLINEESILNSSGSPMLDGIFQTIGTGVNMDLNDASPSLLQAQTLGQAGVGPGIVSYMDNRYHNLAGIKGMNL